MIWSYFHRGFRWLITQPNSTHIAVMATQLILGYIFRINRPFSGGLSIGRDFNSNITLFRTFPLFVVTSIWDHLLAYKRKQFAMNTMLLYRSLTTSHLKPPSSWHWLKNVYLPPPPFIVNIFRDYYINMKFNAIAD